MKPRAVIYGIGQDELSLYKEVEDTFEILYFVDVYAVIKNEQENCPKVVSKDVFSKTTNKDDFHVLVASSNYEQACCQLIDMGFERENIIITNPRYAIERTVRRIILSLNKSVNNGTGFNMHLMRNCDALYENEGSILNKYCEDNHIFIVLGKGTHECINKYERLCFLPDDEFMYDVIYICSLFCDKIILHDFNGKHPGIQFPRIPKERILEDEWGSSLSVREEYSDVVISLPTNEQISRRVLKYFEQFAIKRDKYLLFRNLAGRRHNAIFIEFINKFFSDTNLVFAMLNTEDMKDLSEKYDNLICFPYAEHMSKYFEEYVSLMAVFSEKYLISSLTSYDKDMFTKYEFDKMQTKIYWISWGGDIYSCIPNFKLYEPLTRETCKSIDYKPMSKEVLSEALPYIHVLLSHGEMEAEYFDTHNNCGYEYFTGPFFIPNPPFKVAPSLPSASSLKKKWGVRHIALVTNSCTPECNHIDVFYRLAKICNQDFAVVCPLNYGTSSEYGQVVYNVGHKLFGDRFFSLTEYLSFEQYSFLLNESDIVISHHLRQQALGNITMAFIQGKKVFLNRNGINRRIYSEVGQFFVFDIMADDFINTVWDKMDQYEINTNKKLAKDCMDDSSIYANWKRVLYDLPAKESQ